MKEIRAGNVIFIDKSIKSADDERRKNNLKNECSPTIELICWNIIGGSI